MGGRVLFVGQAGAPTGFARVVESLAAHLPPEWEPHVLGTNGARGALPRRVRLHVNPDPRDLRAASELARVLERVRPRLVFVLDEPRGCVEYRALIEGPRDWRVVLYAAVDRLDCVTRERAAALAGLDGLVAFSEHGRRVLEVGLRRWRGPGPRPTPTVIPHGVDTRVFRPLAGDPARGETRPARRLARARLFARRPELQADDVFLVLNANRNQPSKRIDVTLEGFALFARGKPANVKLYLHMGTRPRAPGEVAAVDALGVRERVLGVVAGDHPSLAPDELNVLYNACDVGLNTSEGEGFGLIALEHAAAGAAQVVPRHSACAELWSEAGVLLEPVRRTQLMGCRTAGRTVTPQTVADALERLYADRGWLAERSAAAYLYATQARFDWRRIASEWGLRFEALLAAEPGQSAP